MNDFSFRLWEDAAGELKEQMIILNMSKFELKML